MEYTTRISFMMKAKCHIGLYKQRRDDKDISEAFNCLSILINNIPENTCDEHERNILAEAYNMRGMIHAGEISRISV